MFNDAKLGQGSREGMYEETTLVNGNPAWVSTTGNAIWKSGNRWYFGPTSGIGSTSSWIASAFDDNPECPDQASSWRVYKSGEWVDAASGDVSFDCYEFKGNVMSLCIHRPNLYPDSNSSVLGFQMNSALMAVKTIEMFF